MYTPDTTPSASDGRGTGREVQDDAAAAQQYALDLQVLFYSLKTIASSSRKNAVAKAVRAAKQIAATTASTVPAATQTEDGEGRRNSFVGTFDVGTTTALHRQLGELTEQLAVERRERTKLQEQLTRALAMLRKSYGQIADDYLFATEQLHERTRQLESLLEAGVAAARPMQSEFTSSPFGSSGSGPGPTTEEANGQPHQSAAYTQVGTFGRLTYPDVGHNGHEVVKETVIATRAAVHGSGREEADHHGSKISISRSASDRGVMSIEAAAVGADCSKHDRAGGSGNRVAYEASQAAAVYGEATEQGRHVAQVNHHQRLSRHRMGEATARAPSIPSVAVPGPASVSDAALKAHANKADTGIELRGLPSVQRFHTRQQDSDVSSFRSTKVATTGAIVPPLLATPMSITTQIGAITEGTSNKPQANVTQCNPILVADDESTSPEPSLPPPTHPQQRFAASGSRLRGWGQEAGNTAAGITTQWAVESPPAARPKSPVELVTEASSPTQSSKLTGSAAFGSSPFASTAHRAAFTTGVSTWPQPHSTAVQHPTTAPASDHFERSRDVLQGHGRQMGTKEAVSDGIVWGVGATPFGAQNDGTGTIHGWFTDEARVFVDVGARHGSELDDMEALSGAAAALEAATRSAQAGAQAAAASKTSAFSADLSTDKHGNAGQRSGVVQVAEAAAGTDTGVEGSGCGSGPTADASQHTIDKAHGARTISAQLLGTAADDADVIHSSKRLRRETGSPTARGDTPLPNVDDTPDQGKQGPVKGPAGGDAAVGHISRRGSQPTPPATSTDRPVSQSEQPWVSSGGAMIRGRRYVQSVPAPHLDLEHPISKERLSERISTRSAPGTADKEPLQSRDGSTEGAPANSASPYLSVAEPRASAATAVAASAAVTTKPAPEPVDATAATQALDTSVSSASGTDGTAFGANTWLRSTHRVLPIVDRGPVGSGQGPNQQGPNSPCQQGPNSSRLNSHRGPRDRMDSSRSMDSLTELDVLLGDANGGGYPEDCAGSPHAVPIAEGCSGVMPATSAVAAIFAAHGYPGLGNDIGSGTPVPTFTDLASLVLGLRQWVADSGRDDTAVDRDADEGGWNTDDGIDAEDLAGELGGYDSNFGLNGVDTDFPSFDGSDATRLDLRKVDLNDLGLSGKGSEGTALGDSPQFSMYDNVRYVASDNSAATSLQPRNRNDEEDAHGTSSAAGPAGNRHATVPPSGSSGGATTAAAASTDARCRFNHEDMLQAGYEARAVLASLLSASHVYSPGLYPSIEERHNAAEAMRSTVPAVSVSAPAAARVSIGVNTQATRGAPAPMGDVGSAAGGQHDRDPRTDQTSPGKAAHSASRWKMAWEEGHDSGTDSATSSGFCEMVSGIADWRCASGGGCEGEGAGFGRARGDIGQGPAGQPPTGVIVERLARELENLRSTFALGLKRRVVQGTEVATEGPGSNGGGLERGLGEGHGYADGDCAGRRSSVAAVPAGSGPSHQIGKGDVSWRARSDVALGAQGETESRPWQQNLGARLRGSTAGWNIGLGGSAGMGGMPLQAGGYEERSAGSRTSTKAHGIVLQGEGC